MGDLALKMVPLNLKIKMGLPAMAKVFSQVSDQASRVEERDDDFVYIIDVCPVCWGKSDNPICHAAVGLIQEGLRWLVEEKSSASRRLRALPAVMIFVNFLYTKILLGRCRMNLCRMNLMGGDDG
jgi:hypothetical protein